MLGLSPTLGQMNLVDKQSLHRVVNWGQHLPKGIANAKAAQLRKQPPFARSLNDPRGSIVAVLSVIALSFGLQVRRTSCDYRFGN
jgi:hypothetical protein